MIRPVVAFVETDDEGSLLRHWFEVTNWAQYPDEMFVLSPDLPPCGLNTSASRTWIEIYDETGERLYGFCAVDRASGLMRLWFAVQRGQPAVSRFYIGLVDRREGQVALSNLVTIPG